MAARTTTIPGRDLLLSLGGTPLASNRDVTLELTQELTDTTTKGSANWAENLPSVRSWRLTASGLYELSSAEVAGSTGTLTIGGDAYKGWDTLTLVLACDLVPTVNNVDGLAQTFHPKVRRTTLEIAGDYYDPAGSGHDANAALLDEILATTDDGLAVVLGWGSTQSVAFTGRPTRGSLSSPYEDQAPGGFSLTATGSPTITDTSAASTIVALFTAFETANQAAALTASFSTTTAGETSYGGSVLIAELRLSIPYQGVVGLDIQLQGTGALTTGTVSA